MAEMTLPIPDELAERIRGMEEWMPTVLELGLSGFRTVAAATASEVIEFLSTNPSHQAVRDYHVSERAQDRLQRLLVLNEAGMLCEHEHSELDELQRIEHIVILLKARVVEQHTGEG